MRQAKVGPGGECLHCGPECRPGAAHNARVEDGVVYEPWRGLTAPAAAAPAAWAHMDFEAMRGALHRDLPAALLERS